jgi:hypothetical protein
VVEHRRLDGAGADRVTHTLRAHSNLIRCEWGAGGNSARKRPLVPQKWMKTNIVLCPSSMFASVRLAIVSSGRGGFLLRECS